MHPLFQHSYSPPETKLPETICSCSILLKKSLVPLDEGAGEKALGTDGFLPGSNKWIEQTWEEYWLVRGRPDLINHDSHHEQEVNSKRPQHDEFRPFEVSPRDKMLLCPNQLIVFERR